MLIKFLPHGKGSASKAASYVLDNVNHLNQERAGVKVLTGDPITFTELTARPVEERKRIIEATESRIRKTKQFTCEYEHRIHSNHQWISETERVISQ